MSYCGDLAGAIFLHTSSDGGTYADMDVDCDGADNGAGACSNDPSGQGMTAFKDQVSQYGISDLNANIHPYVVFGNEGAIPSFDPRQYGMEPLSIMAVVCNGNLVRVLDPDLPERYDVLISAAMAKLALWHMGRYQRWCLDRRGVHFARTTLLPECRYYWRQRTR